MTCVHNLCRGERERGVSVSRDLNKEVLLRRREVCSFYKRSVEADGKDPTTLSDCGRCAHHSFIVCRFIIFTSNRFY